MLERIDGWSDVCIEDLGGGLTNRTYLVTAGKRRCVLKIDPEPRGKPFNSRQNEARVQRTAHAAGLAPEVLYVDERCLLVEYVEGEVWNAQHLHSANNLERLGRALQRVHALPRSGRTFDALGAAQLYAEKLDNRNSADVRERIEIIDSVPMSVEMRFCHNDLVAENIIDAGELMFLDWEYACDNDPLFDLATLVAHHDLNEAQADTLLSAYFEGEWRAWRPGLERQVAGYTALLWLWQAARGQALLQRPDHRR